MVPANQYEPLVGWVTSPNTWFSEKGSSRLGPQVAPEGIVEAAAELVSAEARDRGVLLEIRIRPPLLTIHADSDRILQALLNLLKNSLKFTNRGGRVTLRVEQGESEVLFSVEDTGVGIEAADLSHAFERYWQKPRRGETGTGLGLAIVEGIVGAHAGQIRVQSTPGKGSGFSFTIPSDD